MAMKFDREKIELWTAVIARNYRIVDCLGELGLRAGIRVTMKKFIATFNIDTSHFVDSRILQRRNVPLSEKMVKDSTYDMTAVKKQAIKEGFFQEVCSDCGRTEWTTQRLGTQKIKLDMHHINGDNKDHRPENVVLLCKLCHAYTENFTKAKTFSKRIFIRNGEPREGYDLCPCGRLKQINKEECMSCINSHSRVILNAISDDEIIELRDSHTQRKLCGKLHVNPKALEKRVKDARENVAKRNNPDTSL